MKKKLIVLLSVAMGVAVIAYAEIKPGEKPAPKSDAAQMRDEINALKAKIELLEYRTKSLETTVHSLQRSHTQTSFEVPASSPSLVTPSPIESKPPTIWGQREVNGWTYYIVPCEQPSR
jgi:hypothetical protein